MCLTRQVCWLYQKVPEFLESGMSGQCRPMEPGAVSVFSGLALNYSMNFCTDSPCSGETLGQKQELGVEKFSTLGSFLQSQGRETGHLWVFLGGQCGHHPIFCGWTVESSNPARPSQFWLLQCINKSRERSTASPSLFISSWRMKNIGFQEVEGK